MVIMAALSLTLAISGTDSWEEALQERTEVSGKEDGHVEGKTTEELLTDATNEMSERLGSDLSWVLGEGMSRQIVEGDVPDAAEELLRAYQSGGRCTLAQAGYLDLVGNVWSCTVQGEGWVEVAVVRALIEGGSEVTTIRMDADTWERELLPMEGEGSDVACVRERAASHFMRTGGSVAREPSNTPWCSLPSLRASLPWEGFGKRHVRARWCVCAPKRLPMACRQGARLRRHRTSCSIEGQTALRSTFLQNGQSSVEAAVLLPTLMLLMGILMQPAFLLYTRMVMRSAAGECARVLLTASKDDEDACRRFALRRLEAVPNVSPFHVGGRDGWEVTFDYAEDASSVSVDIVGRLRPLPLLGIAASAMGEREGDLLVVRTHVTERLRPAWFGGGYGSWQQMWG